MGFRLKVTGGAEQIALDEKSIKNVVFGSEIGRASCRERV